MSRPDLLVRVQQLRAQSRLLWEQVAELAEAVAEVELEVARVHEGMAAQGGSLAAQAAEHARRARDFAAREQAEAERLRRVVAGWGSSPRGANSVSKSRLGGSDTFCVKERRADARTCGAGRIWPLNGDDA